CRGGRVGAAPDAWQPRRRRRVGCWRGRTIWSQVRPGCRDGSHQSPGRFVTRVLLDRSRMRRMNERVDGPRRSTAQRRRLIATWWIPAVLCIGASRAVAQPIARPVSIAPGAPVRGLTDAIEVSVGQGTLCAVRRTGALVCWGSANGGVLGESRRPDEYADTPVAIDGIADAVHVSVGGSSACAILRSGAVLCWGANTHGELGNG